MSIVSVTEVNESREGEQDWKGVFNYKRRFQIFVSDNTDHSTTILASGLVPARLQVHPDNPYALVSKRTCKNDSAEPLRWWLDVDYTSQFDMDPANTDPDPLARPVITKITFQDRTKAVRKDLMGDSIDNSADTPIDPPMEIEDSIDIISRTKNYASISYPTLAALHNACNSDSFLGFAAGKLKCKVEASQQWENNVSYWTVVFNLHYKSEGWRPTKVLDQGYYGKDFLSDETFIFRDKFLNPLPSPTLLDGFGEKLAHGATPVYLDFYLVSETAFTGVVP